MQENHARDADMEKLLTTAEVAQAVGLTERQIRRLRRRGEGPPTIRIGSAVRYCRKDLEAWLESQRIEGTS